MKNQYSVVKAFVVITSLIALSNCAAVQKKEEGKNISSTGPSIINAHTEPGTIELNRQLQPTHPSAIIADVKDFQAPVQEVTLQFQHVPLEVPMEKVGGSSWRAVLTPRQLQMLAVSGRTITYDANIVARDEQGQVAVSEKPVSVAIKTPDIANPSG